MKKEKVLRRISSTLLVSVMAFGLTACGSVGGKANNNGKSSDGEFVYVPQYYEIEVGENAYVGDVEMADDRIYYSVTSYEKDSLKEQYFYQETANFDAQPVVMFEEQSGGGEDGFESYSMISVVQPQDSIVFVTCKRPVIDYETATEADYLRQEQESTYALKKINADGTVAYEADFAPYMQQAEGSSWLSYGVSDAEGNLYLSNGETHIWVFDKDGNEVCSVSLASTNLGNSYISSMGLLPDGRVAILADNMGEMSIMAFDLEKKSFTDTYSKLPANIYNSDLSVGPNGGVLLTGRDALFEYDLETQTYEQLLTWLDCDLNPDYVNSAKGMENGDILVYYEDWTSNVPNFIVLKKTAAFEVVKKEVLTIGCMSLSQELQSAVVDFNKANDRYKIEVKDYTASIDWSTADENAYADAQTRFLNDIITGNGPDMFVASDVNLPLFASKGIIEDLTPYLENSQVISREDMFESVLNALTIDGVLCTIPTSFNVATLMGRTAEVGEETGWNMDEMLAYLAQYPDSRMLSYANPNMILQYCLMFNFDAYVNWETGECYFDSPEFKKVLELAASYYGVEYNPEDSLPKDLANHSVLMDVGSFSEVQSWQVEKLLFGEPITAIGFPTSDGKGGIAASVNGALCINATSKYKDVAWSFMEGMLTEEALMDSFFSWGFSINKNVYNVRLEEAMTPNYLYDEEGNEVLDENGNPIEVSNYSYGYDDVTFEIYSVKAEEAEALMEVINGIDTIMSYDEKLMNIIFEEAEGYFAGQKSVDKVADIIQGRAKIYVSESR